MLTCMLHALLTVTSTFGLRKTLQFLMATSAFRLLWQYIITYFIHTLSVNRYRRCLHFLSVMCLVLAVSRIWVMSVSRTTMSSVTWQAVASWCIKCSMLNACKRHNGVSSFLAAHQHTLLQWRAPSGVLPCRWYVAREHDRWTWIAYNVLMCH